jgi:hypothetical protein
MKFKLLLAGCVLAATTQLALAADVPADSVAMSTVIQNIHDAGYPVIEEVEFNDNNYEADVITAQGQEVTVWIDTKGTVSGPDEKLYTLSMLDAVKKAEGGGYSSIYEVESGRSYYSIKALNDKGEKTDIKISKETSEISNKGWLDKAQGVVTKQ